MMAAQTRAITRPYSEMVKPTDSASMEVATPCTSRAFIPRAGGSASSPPRIPYSSILPPMYPSKSRAIQGINCSKALNHSRTVRTQSQPKRGMAA